MNSQPELDFAVGDTIIGFLDSGEQIYIFAFCLLPLNQILNAAYSDGENRNLARVAEL